jgi:glycosyltransferase involved in cell wall biosynthesis/phosphorylcholine metabolism protein LicD
MDNKSFNQPPVSVIVPAYNVGPYIEQCLQSLKSQSLPSIQIIVVDDGSSDDTPERIRALQNGEGPPIEVIRQENAGLSAARNAGMAVATGQFIGFVDGDDWVSPRMFEKLYCRAVETDSEVVVCAGLKRWPDGGRKRIRLRIPAERFGSSASRDPEIIWGAQSYAWNKIYARDLIRRESFRFPHGKLFEDSAVVYGLVARAKRVDVVNEALYQYRGGRVGAITQAANPRIFDIFDSCDSMRKSLADLGNINGIDDVGERLARTHLLARLPALRASASPILSTKFTHKALGYLDKHYPGWRTRYARDNQTWIRYYSRRNTLLAVLASFLAPVGNLLWSYLAPVRRVFRYVQQRVAGLRRVAICGLAARKLNKAFKAESIPYTLDFETLQWVLEGRRLGRPIDVAVLPSTHAIADIAVALRQQGLQLGSSYLYEERCYAQHWRLRSRLLGTVKIEMRFLEATSEGTLRTRFFYRDKSAEAENSCTVFQLTTPRPTEIVQRRVLFAGSVDVVKPGDPFATARMRPELHRPRDFRSDLAQHWGVETLDESGHFHDGMPPKPTETIRRAHDEQMDILKQMLNFCAERSLHPLLADGSLLGGVRHQGYIPWDDDIDLWMLRSEFEELIAAELPEGLTVLHFTTNDKYHLGFAKIVRLESAFEWSYPRGLQPAGASIDVFPLDWSASPERLSERVRARLVRLLRQVIRAKYRFPESKRRHGRRLLSRLLPGVVWHRILRAIVVAPPLGEKTNLTSWFSGYPAHRASYPATWILPAGELPFEGLTVAAPRDPARVLTRTYGDFTQLPSPARRTSPNHFLKLRASEQLIRRSA